MANKKDIKDHPSHKEYSFSIPGFKNECTCRDCKEIKLITECYDFPEVFFNDEQRYMCKECFKKRDKHINLKSKNMCADCKKFFKGDLIMTQYSDRNRIVCKCESCIEKAEREKLKNKTQSVLS